MIIVKLSGGLGNQMFEYALYLSLLSRGKEVKIDDSSDYRAPDRRPVQNSSSLPEAEMSPTTLPEMITF